jgi:hypothetical protein
LAIVVTLTGTDHPTGAGAAPTAEAVGAIPKARREVVRAAALRRTADFKAITV